MTFATSYLISTLLILAIAVFDRWVLKRGHIDIMAVNQCEYEPSKFILVFNTKHRLKNSELTYTIRDKKNPTTVIAGKNRTLDFSPIGLNDEYIAFEHYDFPPHSSWQIDIQICTCTCSHINPLYKIFPLNTRYSKEVYFV